MKTTHSILFVGALFATFMAVGMEQASPALQTADPRDCGFVQDNNSLHLMLIYHNPARGVAAASCGNAPPRPGSVAG